MRSSPVNANFSSRISAPNSNSVFDAIAANDVETLRRIITRNASINVTSARGRTPLQFAVERGLLGPARFLVDNAGARVSKTEEWVAEELIIAASAANVDMLHVLLDVRADVNSVNQSGQSPLEVAISFNRPQCIQILINAGARVHAYSSIARQAVCRAAESGDVQALKLLVLAKASVDHVDENGFTPLGLAQQNRQTAAIDFLAGLRPSSTFNVKNGIEAFFRHMLDAAVVTNLRTSSRDAYAALNQAIDGVAQDLSAFLGKVSKAELANRLRSSEYYPEIMDQFCVQGGKFLFILVESMVSIRHNQLSNLALEYMLASLAPSVDLSEAHAAHLENCRIYAQFHIDLTHRDIAKSDRLPNAIQNYYEAMLVSGHLHSDTARHMEHLRTSEDNITQLRVVVSAIRKAITQSLTMLGKTSHLMFGYLSHVRSELELDVKCDSPYASDDDITAFASKYLILLPRDIYQHERYQRKALVKDKERQATDKRLANSLGCTLRAQIRLTHSIATQNPAFSPETSDIAGLDAIHSGEFESSTVGPVAEAPSNVHFSGNGALSGAPLSRAFTTRSESGVNTSHVSLSGTKTADMTNINRQTALPIATINHDTEATRFVPPLSREPMQRAQSLRQGTQQQTQLLQAVEQDDATGVSRICREEPGSLEARNAFNMTPLMVAACKGNTHIAQILIAARADVETRDSNGWTALQLAAEHGHEDLVQMLSATGAVIDAKDALTALTLAAGRGHEDIVRNLVRAKAQVDTTDTSGRTPLMHAAENGKVGVARVLIASNANLESKNMKGRTVLHLGVMRDQGAIVELLTDAKADLEARDNHGMTPLMLAAAENRKEVATMLISKRADMNAVDGDGWTPLSFAYACQHQGIVDLLLSCSAVVTRTTEMLKLVWEVPSPHAYTKTDDSSDEMIHASHLSRDKAEEIPSTVKYPTPVMDAAKSSCDSLPSTVLSPADADAQAAKSDRNKATAQLFAAIHANKSQHIVRDLIAANASLDAIDGYKRSPLQLAFRKGHLPLAKVLLSCGARIPVDSSKEVTWALQFASGSGDIELIRMLLTAKADIDAPSQVASKPLLCIAIDNHQKSTVDFLIEMGASLHSADKYVASTLMRVTANGDEEMLKVMLETKVDLHHVEERGERVMQVAIDNRNVNIARRLLNAGASVAEEYAASTTIHAVKTGDTEILDIMLDSKVDVTGVTEQGKNLLQLAIENNRGRIAEVLLAAGVTPSVPAGVLRGALFSAARMGDVPMLRALIRARGDIHQVSHIGKSLLDTALENFRAPILRVLVENGVEFDPHSRSIANAIAAAQAKGNDDMVSEIESAKSYMITKRSGRERIPRSREVQMVAVDADPHAELMELFKNYGISPTPAQTSQYDQPPPPSGPLPQPPRAQSISPVATTSATSTPVASTPIASAPVAAGTSRAVSLRHLLQNEFAPDEPSLPQKTTLHPEPNISDAVFVAVDTGNVDMLRSLIAGKADVNATDANGCTPLYHAQTNNQHAIAQMLIKAGAKGKDLLRLLCIAITAGRVDVVKELIVAKAPVNATNAQGLTPLELARKGRHKEIVALLMQAGAVWR